MVKEEKKSKVILGGMDMTKRGRNLVWPIFLIFVGVMLLLNSLSIIEWSLWLYLLRFWPIFLVLGGLRLIFGHSKVGEIILAFIAICLFSGIVFVSYISNTEDEKVWFFPTSIVKSVRLNFSEMFEYGGEAIEKDMSVTSDDYENVDEIELSIDVVASTFTIVDDDSGEYLELQSKHYENLGVPKLETELKDGVLDIAFTSEYPNGSLNWRNTSPEYDFTLSDTESIYSLDIDLGAGEGTIDLDSIKTDSIEGNIGAGGLDVTLGESSIPSESISFDIGAGEATLNIPSDISFSLTYSIGVGEISLNNDAIVSFIGDGVYKSSNFGDVDTNLDIEVNVGVGAFNIVNN